MKDREKSPQDTPRVRILEAEAFTLPFGPYQCPEWCVPEFLWVLYTGEVATLLFCRGRGLHLDEGIEDVAPGGRLIVRSHGPPRRSETM